MKIRFWGVRGSIPVPSARTVIFGGNTSCVSAHLPGQVVIFDAGTGLRNLGKALLAQDSDGTQRDDGSHPHLHLFLSHLHWDHIQGFPFFGPCYTEGWDLNVYGRVKAGATLGQVLAGQMEGPNFPVSIDQLAARITCTDLLPNQGVDLPGTPGQPGIRVDCAPGRHPNGVLAYRLTDRSTGKSVVYATDTEHPAQGLDQELSALGRGADTLIYDGMFTPEDYENHHKGWGHSTWEKGFELAAGSGVRRLVVFHHSPDHDDDFLSAYEQQVRAACRRKGSPIELVFAREGMEIGL